MKKIDKFTIDLVLDKENNSVLTTEEYIEVVKKLKNNKISFIELFKNNNVNNSCFSKDEFITAFRNEEIHYNNWRSEFLLIKQKWEDENIDYIFHKSIGKFPYLSDNLDVLVKPEDFKRAGEILLDLGYVNLRNIQEAHKQFYRKFEGKRAVCPIHLHERVCWSVPYEDNDHLWNNYLVSSEDELVHYPSEEDAILINTAHCFLEDHLVKVYDLLTIGNCINRKNINWDYIYKTSENLKWQKSLFTGFIIFEHVYKKITRESIFPEEVINKAFDYVKDIKWITSKLKKDILIDINSVPFYIPHLWTRRHSSTRIFTDNSLGTMFYRIQIIFTSLLDGFIHNKLKIKSHAPLFVVFSGIDGSGKSSLIKTIIKNHSTCDIKSKVIWSRAGSLPIINSLLKLAHTFSGNSSKKTKIIVRGESKELTKNQLTISLWRLINSIEMIFWFLIKIKIPLLFGRSIIADRYIYDSIIDMEILNNSSNYSRPIYKFLELLTPKPDLIFHLNVNVDNIISRGTDELRDDLVIKESHYERLLSSKEVLEIDNNENFNSVSSKLTQITLKKLFDKHPEKSEGYKVVSFKYK